MGESSGLPVAFAVYAAVVAMIGAAIVWELARLRAEVRVMARLLNLHQIETAGRLAALEAFLNVRDGYKRAAGRFGRGDTE